MIGAEQDNPKVVYKYDSDDRQILIDLLHEYSEKLLAMSRENILAGNQGKWRSKSTTFKLWILLVSICISYLFWNFIQASEVAMKSGGISSYMLHQDLVSTKSFIVVLCTAIPLFCWIYLISPPSMKGESTSQKNPEIRKIESDLREKDAQLIAGKLESVMRLTVEVTNQVETNLARKLELDLRLADASHALEYYQSVVRLNSKPHFKRQEPWLINILKLVSVSYRRF